MHPYSGRRCIFIPALTAQRFETTGPLGIVFQQQALMPQLAKKELGDRVIGAFPMPLRLDRDAVALGGSLATGVADGRSIAIYCRAGIGRSSVIAACSLICAGIDADSALTLIKDARGVGVSDTDEQREWIIAFDKAHQKSTTTGNNAC
jgi:hypothetical protein